MLQRSLRIFRTVRHLNPSQLFWFVRRRVIKSQRREIFLPDVISARDWHWPMEAGQDVGLPDTVTFRFLNVERRYLLGAVDWSPQDVNRLWRYNLHYFDFLSDTDRSADEKNALILDWIAKNPLGSEAAWEPYTASLRIVNWCKWLSVRPFSSDSTGNAAACRSLYRQALWLEQNLELHILANHYFENLKALVFAGAFFDGEDGRRWLSYGISELRYQLQEQILSDGCHYERAPQYHCVILDDVLDFLQLARLLPDLFPADFVGPLIDSAQRMAGFLADILNPCNHYPLFNDSAVYDVEPAALLMRAEGLGLVFDRPDLTPRLIDRPDAGFYGYRAGDDWIMLDCGEIGPAYQPGHTHCDMLSYELMIGGVPVAVDTGVFEYEPGELRRLVRSTAAHNVVQVDDAEQSEIWGEFRVARRAKKRGAAIRFAGNDVDFSGRFSGFHSLGSVMHERRVTIERDAVGKPLVWRFTDLLGGKGAHRLRSYIHLHPDIVARLEDSRVVLIFNGKPLAHLMPAVSSEAASWRMSLEPSVYCPEFGLMLDSRKIVIEWDTVLPARFGYSILRMDL